MSFDQLKTLGYTLIPEVFDKQKMRAVRTELERLYDEDSKSNSLHHDAADQAICRTVFRSNPKLMLSLFKDQSLMRLFERVFPDGYVLQSMNASMAKPGDFKKNKGIGVHIDSKYPGAGIENTTALGIAFCIDDFTKENGATQFFPFSHLSGVNPRKSDFDFALPPAVDVTASSGDVLIFLSQTWHTVGENVTRDPRWGIFSFLIPWWVKSTWDFRDCGAENFNQLEDFDKQLLGFLSPTPSMNSVRSYTKIASDVLPSDYESAKAFK